MEEYRSKLQKKTCNAKELSQLLGVSVDKAYQLMRIDDAPVIKIGRNKLFILSKLDEFLETLIGRQVI